MFTFSKVGRAMLHSPKRKDMIWKPGVLACGHSTRNLSLVRLKGYPLLDLHKGPEQHYHNVLWKNLVICVASTRRAALQSLQYIMTSKIKSTQLWSGVILSQFQTNFTQKETFWNSHQAKFLKWIRRLKWRFSCQEFEDQNTQCPPVDIDVMPTSLADVLCGVISRFTYLPWVETDHIEGEM